MNEANARTLRPNAFRKFHLETSTLVLPSCLSESLIGRCPLPHQSKSDDVRYFPTSISGIEKSCHLGASNAGKLKRTWPRDNCISRLPLPKSPAQNRVSMRAEVDRALRFPSPCRFPRHYLGLRVPHVSHRRSVHSYSARPGSRVFHHSSSSPQRRAALTPAMVAKLIGKTVLEQLTSKFKTYYDTLPKSVIEEESAWGKLSETALAYHKTDQKARRPKKPAARR